jgi:hypothetical protein
MLMAARRLLRRSARGRGGVVAGPFSARPAEMIVLTPAGRPAPAIAAPPGTGTRAGRWPSGGPDG